MKKAKIIKNKKRLEKENDEDAVIQLEENLLMDYHIEDKIKRKLNKW